jgi:RNA polymerase sigma-70 factor (ECF subfamily)
MLVVSEREQLPVREARAGKPEAWDALFKRYQLSLYTYVFELVHHEQSALDIVQETFINSARHIGGLRDDHKFGSWLFGIAHQKCIQHWRKRRPETVPIDAESDDFTDHDASPGELLIRKEQEEQFMKFLEQLSVPHRSVLLLHFVEDFSLEEIARITETQLGTVKSRMHYAREALRKLLEQDKT